MKNRTLLKASSLAASAVLALTMTMPVCAANSTAGVTESQNVSAEGDTSCTVVLERDSDYTITLPKTVALSSETKSGEFDFTLTGDIAGNEYINVSANKFAMSSNGKTDVEATPTITNGKLRSNGYTKDLAEGEAKFATGGKISIAAPDLTAGHWEGVMQVNVAVGKDS